MADSTVAPKEIPFQSQLPNIIDLAKYVGGTKATETGTATTTGQTAPLEALLANVNDPNNLLALVQLLFSQGAAQVPGLTSQYANATGTRVDNNSMLASSLAQLNQTLAQSIAQSVVAQQQGVALPAAAKIADANKVQTTTGAKTTQPRSLLSSAGSIGGGLLIGSAANKLGKKLFPADEPVVAPTAPINVPEQLSGPGSGYEPPVVTAGPDIAGTADLSAGLGVGLDASLDAASIGGALSDTSDFVPDLGSFIDDTAWLGFYDGGAVRKKDSSRSYADGGEIVDASTPPRPVARNIPYTGGAPALHSTVAALLPLLLAAQTPAPVAAAKRKGATPAEPDASGESSTSASATPGGSTTGGSLGMGTALGAGLSAASALAGGFGIAGAVNAGITAAAHAIAAHSIADALAGTAAADDLSGMGDLGEGFGGDFSGVGVGTTGDVGIGAGLGGDAGDSGSGEGGSDTGGGDSGGGDSGGGFSDGGKIPGVSGRPMPQREQQKSRKNPPSGVIRGEAEGIDSVAIHATPGEYMLPVDVVDYIGRDELDALVNAIHIPLRSGTHG